MKATKITSGDIANKTVASLPTRPTLPSAFGGKGYTAEEVKAAFDKLPLYIVERYNELIDDIRGADGGTVADAISTGIEEGHTLFDLFDDIKSGAFSAYLKVADSTLAESILKLRADVNAIAAALKISL